MSTGPEPRASELAELPAHPVGTLAIVLLYAALFVLGWVAIYVALFLARGATTT